MLDTGLFALGGRLSRALAQYHQASACDPLSQAPWTPACTLVRNQVFCSPCFKDSSGKSSYLWLPSSTLLMTAYRMWCSGPSSSYPIISETGGWRLWLYKVRTTSHARMAMATQCWKTHQGRLEEVPLPGGWASGFLLPRSAMSYALWVELEKLQAFLFGRHEGSWGLRAGEGEVKAGTAHAPSCLPGKDLLPWQCLGHGLLRIAIHPTRLSELPWEIHL